MKHLYSDDESTQIVLALLKAHGIRKVIASPGTTNIGLVGSMQQDPWFQIFSSVDERSAAYMACGLASESGEAVVLSCTGATASRNYFPGLTEAYYRKLPVLAITGSHGDEKIGHLHAQVLDRRNAPSDSVRYSTSIRSIHSDVERWYNIVEVNKAILELFRHGGGPVHINLEANSLPFNTPALPKVRVIRRFFPGDELPEIKAKKVAIFVGAHRPFTKEETNAIDRFCATHNGVVFCDHTSGYNGQYKVLYALVASQNNYRPETNNPDLLIQIGEISGEFYNTCKLFGLKDYWRVSEDGEIRDLFHSLTNVFEMSEQYFFSSYSQSVENQKTEYLCECLALYKSIYDLIPEDLSFGNIWIAYKMHQRIPYNSIMHFSILNSLRSWNFFNLDDSISTRCNVGGFGIDGPISTLLGSSLVNPHKIHFGVIGDLAFFYDLNSLGNRHVSSNIRIMLINNGRGTEFRNYDHPASLWGDDADLYMAAGGHFGAMSHDLVKHYATDLGFEYMSADKKEDFMNACDVFFSSDEMSKPLLLEVYTDSILESKALQNLREIMPDDRNFIQKSKSEIRTLVVNLLGTKGVNIIKELRK